MIFLLYLSYQVMRKKNHSAHVLTSFENLQLIREKEMKADESKAKDLRKQQREKNAIE